MAGVPVEQLDAATRQRLGLGGKSGRTRPPPSRSEEGVYLVRCHSCAEELHSEGQVKKHMDATGHRRYENPL